MINKIKKYSFGIFMFLLSGIFIWTMFGSWFYYNCNKENLVAYADENYYWGNVIVGSGRTESFHFGAINKEDYEKWENGESGTVWINNLRKENWGNRVNNNNITSIVIYDKDDWLPLNFFY